MTFPSFNTLNMFGNNMYGSNTFSMPSMFGGFNFGGFGSSIFNMGYGTAFMDCNGNVNYGAMAGWAVGEQLINGGLMALNYALSGRSGGSSDTAVADSLNSDLDTCLSSIGDILNKLGIEVSPSTYTVPDDTSSIKSNNVRSAEELVRQLGADNSGATDDQKTEAQNKLNEARKEQADLLAELRTLITQRNQIQNQINNEILDQADGTQARHRDTTITLENFSNAQIDEREDIAQLIYLFRTATDDESKRNIAQKIQDIQGFGAIASNDQCEAKIIIERWLQQHPAQSSG